MVCPMVESLAAGLTLQVHSGNFYEQERGLAHVTEHFLSLSTQAFPTERAISEELESIGAANNASTGDRNIEVWMHLPAKNLERGLKLLSEFAFKSTIPAAGVEKERGVVLQEWKNRHDQPNFRFYRRMREERLNDPNHLYVRDESKRMLETYRREDVLAFYERFFQPQQMVLGIGGGISPLKTLKLVERYFGGVPKGQLIPEPVVEVDSYAGAKQITHEEKFIQASLEVDFPAFGWRERPRKERLAAGMAVRILGGGIVSRLWRDLREERGWVYGVGSGMDLEPWLGISSVHTSCSVERLPEVTGEVRKVVDEYLSGGPTDREVSLEKEYRLGRLATGFEDSLGMARYFVGQEFDGEGILSLEDRIKLIESVTKSDIWEAAKPLFDWKRVQVGLMNDFTQISKEKFQAMASAELGCA